MSLVVINHHRTQARTIEDIIDRYNRPETSFDEARSLIKKVWNGHDSNYDNRTKRLAFLVDIASEDEVHEPDITLRNEAKVQIASVVVSQFKQEFERYILPKELLYQVINFYAADRCHMPMGDMDSPNAEIDAYETVRSFLIKVWDKYRGSRDVSFAVLVERAIIMTDNFETACRFKLVSEIPTVYNIFRMIAIEVGCGEFKDFRWSGWNDFSCWRDGQLISSGALEDEGNFRRDIEEYEKLIYELIASNNMGGDYMPHILGLAMHARVHFDEVIKSL